MELLSSTFVVKPFDPPCFLHPTPPLNGGLARSREQQRWLGRRRGWEQRIAIGMRRNSDTIGRDGHAAPWAMGPNELDDDISPSVSGGFLSSSSGSPLGVERGGAESNGPVVHTSVLFPPLPGAVMRDLGATAAALASEDHSCRPAEAAAPRSSEDLNEKDARLEKNRIDAANGTRWQSRLPNSSGKRSSAGRQGQPSSSHGRNGDGGGDGSSSGCGDGVDPLAMAAPSTQPTAIEPACGVDGGGGRVGGENAAALERRSVGVGEKRQAASDEFVPPPAVITEATGNTANFVNENHPGGDATATKTGALESPAGGAGDFADMELDPVAESYERGRWLLGLLVLQSTSSFVLDKYQVGALF